MTGHYDEREQAVLDQARGIPPVPSTWANGGWVSSDNPAGWDGIVGDIVFFPYITDGHGQALDMRVREQQLTIHRGDVDPDVLALYLGRDLTRPPAEPAPRWVTDYSPAAVRAPYAARATAPAGPVAGSDVDDITATIEGLCACPCRAPIPPDGPSAYYASPECQRRWNQAQHGNAEDSHRIDQRPDWEPGWMDDQYHSTADPAGAVVTTDVVGHLGHRPVFRRSAEIEHDLVFRRSCTACGAVAPPVGYQTVDNGAVGRRQVCGGCGHMFDGALYASVTTRHRDGSRRLRMSNGFFWESYQLDDVAFEAMTREQRRAEADRIWAKMWFDLTMRTVGAGNVVVDPPDTWQIMLRHTPVLPPHTPLSIIATGV